MPGTEAPARAAKVNPPLLIVDDDLLFVATLHRMLAKEYTVEVVHHAEEALARVQRGDRFGAIVCAMHLPELTGIALHEALLAPSPDQAKAMVFIINKPPTRETLPFIKEMSARCVRRPFEITALKSMIASNLRPAPKVT